MVPNFGSSIFSDKGAWGVTPDKNNLEVAALVVHLRHIGNNDIHNYVINELVHKN